MPAVVTVHVVVADDARVPVLSGPDGEPLESWFSQASDGELEIRLLSPRSVFIPNPSRAGDLHQVVTDVLGVPPRRPVDEIALIFCRSWAGNRNLQGLMFDYDGSDPLLGQFTSSGGVPRQACAVFLDAFDADDRGQAFATIHELGHVFNLQHDPRQKSFLATKRQVWGFSALDCERLRSAGRGEWNFAPGGTNFGAATGGATLWRNVRRSRGVRLEAKVAKRRYLPGESVVLDLTMKASRSVNAGEFDPGYETLRIWIENEIGERRLYRPPMFFCLRRAGEEKGATVRSNPRISLGNRGVTFRSPGVYRVWAEFLIETPPHARAVRSNLVEFRVAAPVTRQDEAIVKLLTRSRVAAFIARKGGFLPEEERAELEAAVSSAGEHPALQHARYALGIDGLCRGLAGEALAFLDGVLLKESSLRRKARQAVDRLKAGASVRTADRPIGPASSERYPVR